MNPTTIENSDSDSVDSWSLVEPTQLDPITNASYNELESGVERDNQDQGYVGKDDDDTDGVSVINDSDQELATHSDIDDGLIEQNITDLEHTKLYHLSSTSLADDFDHALYNDNNNDYVENENVKLKTYVHRKNKKLSTVLNIIVLGSVITAAGVAIGHMWGVRDDCLINFAPSVNKILSNLYKLQKENTYLRNKLKELTLIGNLQFQQKKSDSNKSVKNNKCKKIFEDSLSNRQSSKFVKCVDSDFNTQLPEVKTVQRESDFLDDINKLHETYKLNKSWLDQEIDYRLKKELTYWKKAQSKDVKEKTKCNNHSFSKSGFNSDVHQQPDSDTINKTHCEKSYADTVKINNVHKNTCTSDIRMENLEHDQRKERKKRDSTNIGDISQNSYTDVKKDDRYNDFKIKKDLKRDKKNHKNIHKYKKKKYNYNNLRELKNLQDFDDMSIMSFDENEQTSNVPKNDESGDTNTEAPLTALDMNTKNDAKENPDSWYSKRVYLRAEAREKLEKSLGKSSFNNGDWWFRRVKNREEHRLRGDKITNRNKHSKPDMNYKTKH